MKKLFQYALPLFFFVMLCSFALHKFYVGIYQVNYVAKKKEIQITTRIFIDDLEKALEAKYKKKMYLATPKEISETNGFIKSYLDEKFHLKVNTSVKNLKFLGKETEDNVLICYLTTSVPEKITSVEIYNTVLTEKYPEQQNIVHVNINGNKKSLLLTDSEPEGSLEF
ncbi:hypothetical protein FCR2A7T_15570 [Flavobacterium cauense R2A-7]|uniref:Peptidase E n=1 Tax=Flavobacterium cauense R2A-7 TaxID=1341154 RepID=V6S0F5_9FLAO|nr:DUF6702 family protein [Flavobacterium cauense]ESU20143.1 hypothetical protein FCR2A7T_15570 [Flavobacterium cauense R2A-7]KGO83944.1 hypothetical protein Q762_01490 [Flavobacterium cauense R2A-7]TWI14716.1 hypothetical protein IP98_00687 [Flavobacterium cauense R2A-7]